MGVVLFDGGVPAIFGVHMAWCGEDLAFVVEEFITNGDSMTSTQRAF